MTISLEQLSAFLDGELARDEQRRVEDHLPGCSDCRSALGRWREASRALAGANESAVGRRRAPAAVLVAVAALLLTSGIAVAGPFNEIFRSGNVFGVGSRAVTLDEARVTGLPLPRADQLPGGWRVDQVQLVVTPTWRSVDVQYRRPGSRGMGITAWSQDIIVAPNADRREDVTVSGAAVEIGYAGDSLSARFTHRDSTVIVRAFADEIDTAGLSALIAAWIAQAR